MYNTNLQRLYRLDITARGFLIHNLSVPKAPISESLILDFLGPEHFKIHTLFPSSSRVEIFCHLPVVNTKLTIFTFTFTFYYPVTFCCFCNSSKLFYHGCWEKLIPPQKDGRKHKMVFSLF